PARSVGICWPCTEAGHYALKAGSCSLTRSADRSVGEPLTSFPRFPALPAVGSLGVRRAVLQRLGARFVRVTAGVHAALSRGRTVVHRMHALRRLRAGASP